MASLLHVLLVEDVSDDAELLILHLEQDGLNTSYERVDNEADFIEALTSPPDLILSDYSLPQFNGLRALDIVKEKGLDIPFILVSGTIGEEIAVDAIKKGADDYLMKDRPARLGAAVRHALEQKRLRDEKKRSDAALLASQQMYSDLVNTVNGIVWEADAKTLTFRFVSQQAEHLLGYPVERWIEEPSFLKEHIHEDDRAWVLETLANCPCDTTSHELEYRMIRADNQIVWLRSIVTVVLEMGNVVSLRGILVDMTRQKQAEETLKISEERFRNLLDTAPDAIVITDGEGRIVQANAQVERLFDYQSSELVGQAVETLIPEHSRKKHQGHRSKYLRNPIIRNMGTFGENLRGKRKDGSEVPVEISLSSLNIRGNVLVTAIIRDITERKMAEEALLASRGQLRSVLKTIPDRVLQIGPDGIVQFVNRLQNDNPSREIVGASILDQIGEEYHADYQALLKKVLSSGFPGEIETIDIDDHGEQRWYLNRVGPMFENGRVAALIIVRQDITSRKQAEKRIERQIDYLKTLHTIDLTISAGTDLKSSLRAILEKVLSKLNDDAARVLLVNPETQLLESFYGIGFRSKEIEELSTQVGNVYESAAAGLGNTIVQFDLKDTGAFYGRNLLIEKEGFSSYVGIPLIAKGNMKGVLEIFHRQQISPNQEWIDFLESVAGLTAIAIDNATLFQDLQQSNTALGLAYETTLEGWSAALDLRDKETEGHTKRVTQLTLKLAEFLGVESDDLVHIKRGALLHDIGKMGIPDRILLKADELTDDEWKIMRLHPIYAYEMLTRIEYLRPSLAIPYCHHEKWDGTGYPRGLKGEEIPFAARIFSVIDVYDALTSDRPYRPAWTEEDTLGYIKEQSGTYFDPEVVESFLSMMKSA